MNRFLVLSFTTPFKSIRTSKCWASQHLSRASEHQNVLSCSKS